MEGKIRPNSKSEFRLRKKIVRRRWPTPRLVSLRRVACGVCSRDGSGPSAIAHLPPLEWACVVVEKAVARARQLSSHLCKSTGVCEVSPVNLSRAVCGPTPRISRGRGTGVRHLSERRTGRSDSGLSVWREVATAQVWTQRGRLHQHGFSRRISF